MRATRTLCLVRQIARNPEGHRTPRAWYPRLQHRMPRFRWKVQLKCRRRCVFVRSEEEVIIMRRPFCRSRRFRTGLNLPLKAA
jgi:hypothetical protein